MQTQAQRHARYDEISARMQDPELSPEAFLALADEQLRLLEEIRTEMDAELIAEQEALLRDLRAIEVRRSFRYRFHSCCYGLRYLIWILFFLMALTVILVFSIEDDPGLRLFMGGAAALSLVWAVWSSRPPTV